MLFAMLFRDKKELPGLYNAISEKQYKAPEALSVNTLEKAIYMVIKNENLYNGMSPGGEP